MNKNFIYAMLSAIALTGTVGFSSCTSSDEVAEVNPGYNEATGEVPVNFVFNVSTGNTASTRMTAAKTQATIAQSFLGIENANLLSYKQSSAGSHVKSSAQADALFNLGTIMKAGTIDPDGSGSTVPESRRVVELALATGTNALMFWGKAIKTGTDAEQGSIDFHVEKNISNNYFTAKKIVPESITDLHGTTALSQYQLLISTMLSKIVQASANIGTEENPVTLKWSDYVTVTAEETGKITKITAKTSDPADATGASSMCPLGVILANAFVNLNTIYQGDPELGTEDELRAGSGSDICRMMGDLYSVVYAVSQAKQTSDLEEAAIEVATDIVNKIKLAFDPSSNYAWLSSNATGLTNLKNNSGLNTSTQINLVTEDLNLFPSNFGLPLGSTLLTVLWESGKLSYYYAGSVPTYAMGGGSTSSFDPANYLFPPELCYFGNSSIRTSNIEHITSEFPDGVSNWDTETKWSTDWSGNSVSSSTRSVAMKNNINYGTSLLKTTVRYGVEKLYDNNAAIQRRNGVTEQDNEFTASAGLFTLTGILIGGQEQTMGWNYVAKAGTAAKFECMIYDKEIPNSSIPAYTSSGEKSEPCYTLVWDNWSEYLKGQKQRDVYVALEFENNSNKDFWGLNNLIRNGGKFYIIGKLDPDAVSAAKLSELGKTAEQYAADRSLGITWPDKYALPPYDESGNTIKERRVFIQDYMTEANFVFNETSLQHALVTVPDLRSTHISLGLSVDLGWSTGLKYDDVILGE